MRNDLKAIASISHVDTDVDAKSVTVEYQKGTDIEAVLAEVAKENNKLREWAIIQN